MTDKKNPQYVLPVNDTFKPNAENMAYNVNELCPVFNYQLYLILNF